MNLGIFNEAIVSKIKKLLIKKDSKTIALLVGLVGVMLILISNSFSTKFVNKTNFKTEVSKDYGQNEYKKDIEEAIRSIVLSMDGVGNNVNVLVTLECSEQNIYATESKKSTETLKGGLNTDVNKTKESSDVETRYIKIRDQDGTEKALAVTKIQPAIRGVVIVCSNGNIKFVQEKIKNAVKTVLNISAKKVFVTN